MNQAIGGNHGVGERVCIACGERSIDFTLAKSSFLRRMRIGLLKLPFVAKVRAPAAIGVTDPVVLASILARGLKRRKDAVHILVKEDGYTVRQVQGLLLAAASKGTIVESEVEELDVYATEQVSTLS